MDYKIVNLKRSCRKNQGKILIGGTLAAFALFVIVFTLTPNQSIPSPDGFLGEEAPYAPAEQNMERRRTKTITDFDILETYTRVSGQNQYYTEGLVFYDDNTLIESAGLYKKSTIQIVKISGTSMSVTKSAELDNKYFAEGIVVYNDKIYQLTWKERKILVWNIDTLKLEKTLTMPRQVTSGWGLTKGTVTNRGRSSTVFYFSDGTSNIYKVDPDTLEVLKTIPVKKYDGTRVKNLNELEMVNGKIWANIYMTSTIAIIDPSTGYIDYIVDLSTLATSGRDQAKKLGLPIDNGDVLNGIAYDQNNDRMIVTGKMWPLMWEIRVNGV